MKTILLLVLVLGFTSCSIKDENDSIKYNSTDLSNVLSYCKGHAVVVAKGFNEGNRDCYQHYLLIRDDSLNCFEYVGANFDVNVGDTLK